MSQIPPAGRLAFLLVVLAPAAVAQTPDIRRVLSPALPDTLTTAEYDARPAGAPYTGIVRDRWPNGRLKLLRSVEDGRPAGMWTEWYETGVVRYLAEWHPEGAGEGVWYYFHETGVVRDRAVLRQDRSWGLSEGWHADGRKAFEGQYESNRREGLWRAWGTDGVLDREVTFAADTARSVAATWRPGSPSPCTTPCLLAPGVLSTDADEFRLAFAPDGREAYLARRPAGGVQQIYTTRYADGAWTAPALAPFSTGVEEEPFVTADGQRLFFSSRRPVPGARADRSDNLWVMDRADDGWGTPRPLPDAINRLRRTDAGWPVASELGATLLPDGRLLYWTARSDDGDADFYVAAPAGDAFGPPVPLGAPVNTAAFESAAAVSPDGRHLVFQRAGAADGAGQEDLYVATRAGDGWADVRPLAAVNTAASESFPSFTPDGGSLFFASDRSGDWSVYVVAVASLGLGTAP